MDKGLILGTANFGNRYGISGGLDKQQCFDILDAAWDNGIRWLDTARSYGDSEKIIGQYIKPKTKWEKLYKKREFKIITKGDWPVDKKMSIKALGKQPEIYLRHHWEHIRMIPGNRLGIYDGASVYSKTAVHRVLIRKGCKMVNIPLNIFDLTFYDFDFSWYRRIWNRQNPSIVARSIFIQGQAFNMPDIMGIPFYHLCWNFVINHPNIDMVCFGVDSPKQLEDIMKIPQYEIQYDKIGSGEQWIKSIA